MKTPRVSVCCITCRPGGIDVLLSGLSNQEFDDFEVVLVDALYDRRHDMVADAFSRARISLVHTPPRQRILPLDGCPQARNAGIAKARGELILWVTDYSFLPSKCIAEHWGVWEFTKGKKTGMGAHRYLCLPELAYKLPDYAPIVMFKPNEERGVTYAYNEEASRRFVTDIDVGVYDALMYSVFHPPIDSPSQVEALQEDPYFWRADPKLTGLVSGDVAPTMFHAKNESVPLLAVLSVNGFDEIWLGHCYDDSDMGIRLGRGGLSWMLLDPVATVSIVNPRHLFPHLVRRATPHDLLPEFRRREGSSDVVVSSNSYSLSRVRDMGPWWY